MIKLERLPPQTDLAGGCKIVDLLMTSADRERVRRRLTAPDGQDFALALATGTTLRVGAILYQSSDKAYRVSAAPEDVLVVTPRSTDEAAQIGHLIGNLHRDIDLGGDTILTLWTAPLEARLARAGYHVVREQRPFRGAAPKEHAHGFGEQLDALLPPRYQKGALVNSRPMGSAALKYDAAGKVAWHEMWQSFCDLALAGGPTHRGTLLEPPLAEHVHAHYPQYTEVVAELERGVGLTTGLETVASRAPGWFGVKCSSEAMAIWLLRAIIVENVMVRREQEVLYLPAGPDFRLEKEIKNVITVLAKTHHYFSEHLGRPAQP